MSYAESVNKDFITQRTDTISVYNIVFNDTTLAVERRLDIKQRLANWLQYRLKSYNVKVNEIERSVTGTAHDSLQQIQSK